MEDFPPKCGRKRCVKMVVLNLSVLTSVRRIVKIAVRFLHTKTALCDRKDTQSRFAVNAARSIVCVETPLVKFFVVGMCVSMPHAALCVSRRLRILLFHWKIRCFNAARSIVCVETSTKSLKSAVSTLFQCRTQHCVCRDAQLRSIQITLEEFQCRTQHCVCRDYP